MTDTLREKVEEIARNAAVGAWTIRQEVEAILALVEEEHRRRKEKHMGVSEILELVKEAEEAERQRIVGLLKSYFTDWLNAYANRPIDERHNAFDEVADIRNEILDEVEAIEI